jgi:peptide/nickel transport system permease protein
MKTFLVRRFFAGIVSLLGATFLVFGISQTANDPLLLYAKPGGYGVSPEQVQALKEKLGIDRPVPVQYGLWLGRTLRGDLGNSILDEIPVTQKLRDRIPATLKLGIASWIVATLIGVPLGVLSAVKRATVWDYMGRGFALFGQAVPNFWLGIMLVLVFSVQLGWLPSATAGDGFLSITRSAMLEVLDSEYVKMARIKGAGSSIVIWKHAFRNALIPPLTVSATLFAAFLTGALVIEQVFAWPGLGSLAVQAVFNIDFPLLSGITLFFVTVWVTINFLTDVAYVLIDPRIRLG